MCFCVIAMGVPDRWGGETMLWRSGVKCYGYQPKTVELGSMANLTRGGQNMILEPAAEGSF